VKKEFVVILIALTFCYLLFWNIAVGYDFNFTPETVISGDNIMIQDTVSVIVMRYGVLPMYHSSLGNLGDLHSCMGVLLILTSYFIAKKLTTPCQGKVIVDGDVQT